jgi:hypothetical protein
VLAALVGLVLLTDAAERECGGCRLVRAIASKAVWLIAMRIMPERA